MDVRTVGIEEEFLLFDTEQDRLADVGPQVTETADRENDDAQFEKELKRAQAELASSPATDLDRLAAELVERRAELVAAARRDGARVVASGTSPVAGRTATTDDRRYAQMARRFAAIERRQLTCAMHVHVSIDSADEGVAVLAGIAPWLPVLVALGANSPFHEGQDTGYASYRRILWDEWPTAGPTRRFADADDYRRTVRELVASGAARDEGMIYFDARLSANYPTVEIRVCDVGPDPGEAVALAGLIRALVATAASDPPPDGVGPELLRAAGWRAARWGMSGELADLTRAAGTGPLCDAWDLGAALVAHVATALERAGDRERVDGALQRVRDRGTGADRQRAAAGGDPARALGVTTLR